LAAAGTHRRDAQRRATLTEIASEFGGTPMGAFHALRRLKITYKKGLQIT
jgi:hypothetical protein